MAEGGRAWWPNHCSCINFSPLEKLQAEINGFSLQRDAGKGLERSCTFYNTNLQCFREKGQKSSQVPNPGAAGSNVCPCST